MLRKNHRLFQLFFLTIIIAITMSRSASYEDDGGCETPGFGPTASMSAHFVPKIKDMLRKSMTALYPSTPFEEEDENTMAAFIFESMYTPGRVYHSMQHVFNITDNCEIEQDPILLLSTLFHDVVYYTVDKSFQQPQLKLLEGILEFENGVTKEPLSLTENAQDDPLMDMVLRLFDLKAGMELPGLGSNEFLSAIIGIRVLSQWLSFPQLTQLAATIEGTIPFRPASSDGKTAMDRLYDRLVMVAPEQPEDWLEETIHLTASMANCDLCSFDSTNFDFFLDSNWSLVPEFRPALLKEDCPLREYFDEFLAMEGRTKFLISAIPNIFQVFRNVPSESELSEKRIKTRANLNLANDYAQVRRLQLMVLMELVMILGEDPDTIPGRPFLRLELPPSQSPTETDEVFKLLDPGRNDCFPWDPAKSSLGAFLYDKLGKEGIDKAVEVGKNDKLGSYNLLRQLPDDVVLSIATSLGSIMPNHSEDLLQITDKLEIDPGTCASTN